MSVRMQRISAELGRAVQEVITKGLSDPRVRGLITVVGVTVSDDLRQATIRVSVYPAEHEELTLHGLSAASRFIRREAGELMAMARLPELRFKIDQSLKRQAGVLDALAKANAERKDLDAEGASEPSQDSAPAPEDEQP